MTRSLLLMAGTLAASLVLPSAAWACADRAERIRGVVERDIPTGFVSRDVAQRLIADLNQAAEHCRAGRTAQGEAILRRIAATYNYR